MHCTSVCMSSNSMSQIFKIVFQTEYINIFVLCGVFFSRSVQLKGSFSDKKASVVKSETVKYESEIWRECEWVLSSVFTGGCFLQCLQAGGFEPFPEKQTNTITFFCPEKISTVEVFQECKMRWVWFHIKNPDLSMEKCDVCHNWYHENCETISRDVFHKEINGITP